MDSRSVTRRQFLGSAAVLSAAPLVANPVSPTLPVDAARLHLSTPPAVPEPPLPPGVARQFGAARFRDLPAVRGRFSADSRWLIEYDRTKCSGYELATGQKVQFETLANGANWETDSWLVTTDGRLTVVEKDSNNYRLRQFDLPSGVARPPVVIKDGRVVAVSSDALTAVVEGRRGDRNGCWAISPQTGQLRWGLREISQVHSLEPTGVIAAAGVIIGEEKPDFTLRLLDFATGRTADVEPPAVDSRYEFHAAWCTTDRKRVIGHILPVKGDSRWIGTWDIHTGRLLRKYEIAQRGRVIGPTADGDGMFVVIGDNYQLAVRDLTDGKIVRRYEVFEVNDALSGVTPDGRTLLLASMAAKNDREGPPIRLIDADNGRPLPQSPDPSGPLTRVLFPNTSTVGAGYRTKGDNLAYMLWDMSNSRVKRIVPPDTNDVLGGPNHRDPTDAVSADGRIIRLSDGKVSVFDTRLGRTVATNNDLPTGNFRFWLDHSTVAVVRPTGVHLWEPTDDTVRTVPHTFAADEPVELEKVANTKWPSVMCRLSADGGVLGFIQPSRRDGMAIGWIDLKTGIATTATTDKRSNSPPKVTADGRRMMWPITVVEDKRRLPGEKLPPPVLNQFAIHDRDGRRWQVKTEAGVLRYDLTSCGRTLVVLREGYLGGETQEQRTPAIELWEVETGERRWQYPLDRAVNDLKASSCGRYFATVRSDTPVYLWDIYGEVSDPKSTPTPTDLPKLWADLGWAGADRALVAVRTLVQHPAAAVELIGERLKPAVKPKPEWVAAKIDRLSDRDFQIRQATEQELAAVADLIVADLKKAAEAGTDTPEADGRLNRLVACASQPAGMLRMVRAVEVLEYAEGKAAVELLARLADGAEGAVLTREAAAALKRRRWRG